MESGEVGQTSVARKRIRELQDPTPLCGQCMHCLRTSGSRKGVDHDGAVRRTPDSSIMVRERKITEPHERGAICVRNRGEDSQACNDVSRNVALLALGYGGVDGRPDTDVSLCRVRVPADCRGGVL